MCIYIYIYTYMYIYIYIYIYMYICTYRGGHSSGGHSNLRTKHLHTLTRIMPLAMTTPTTTTSLYARSTY